MGMSGAMSAQTKSDLWSTGAGAIQGLGVGMSALGAFNQSTAQKSTLNYESSVATNNSTLAGYQAAIAARIGAERQQDSQLKTAQLFGTQRATLAGNGVDLGSGSANDILTTTKFMGQRDALTIQNNTANQVWADKMQAQNYASEAAADSATAGAINPKLAGVTSLMGGAGMVASSWYKQLGN